MNILNGTFVSAKFLLDRVFRSSYEDVQHALESTDDASAFDQPNLLRRDDVCTDAFGAGWLTNTCTPGKTLCCSSGQSPGTRILN